MLRFDKTGNDIVLRHKSIPKVNQIFTLDDCLEHLKCANVDKYERFEIGIGTVITIYTTNISLAGFKYLEQHIPADTVENTKDIYRITVKNKTPTTFVFSIITVLIKLLLFLIVVLIFLLASVIFFF